MNHLRLIVAVASVLAIVVAGALLSAGFHHVASTERAVVFHRDGSLTTLQPGKFIWVTPVVNAVSVYDVQDRIYTATAVGISLDLQETSTEVTVRYHPRETAIEQIHRALGPGFEAKVVVPAVQDAVKAGVSYFNVEELTGDVRQRVKEDIVRRISADLAEANLDATKISITDFDFSAEFNHAIELKAIAQQKAQEERNRLEQVRYQAEQTVVQAKAQSEASRLLQLNRGDAYLFLQWLQKWDGHLPTTLAGDKAGVLLAPPAPH